MALPLRYIEHLQAGGQRGPGKTRSDAAIAASLTGNLRGFRPIREDDLGFEAAFERYVEYHRYLGALTGKGDPSSRSGYRSSYTFWLPIPQSDHRSVIDAMDQVERDGIPDGFRQAKVWFVQHPRNGHFLPAKAVWGIASGQRGFNAHHARDKLRALGFHVAGPDDPAADLALTPQELVERSAFTEGALRQITTNRRERSPEARREAETHYRALNGGRLLCEGCRIDFGVVYGPRGEGFMHFHHKLPLAMTTTRRQVSGAEDLVPLCPNCHAVVHRGEALLAIDELRSLLRELRST